ncbi:hypothetical protein [Vibrio parahaemolyticus]|nr:MULTISPECIES: hypothetical protein [Bacteria]
MKKYIIVCQCDVPVGWSLESKSDSVTFGILPCCETLWQYSNEYV